MIGSEERWDMDLSCALLDLPLIHIAVAPPLNHRDLDEY
jgi:hypothetical protein